MSLLASGSWAEAPLRVLTSIKPLQLVALGVGGSEIQADALLDPRGSPHDYQLRPSDRSKLDAADIMFWVGPRLEHFLQPALKVLSSRVTQIGLDDGAADPHIWMDPIAMQAVAQRMAVTFATARPAQAHYFYANAQQIKAELGRENEQLQKLFTEKSRYDYIVEHNAYTRFEARYGLRHAATLTDISDLPPSVTAMLQIRSLLDKGEIGCILAEPQESTQLRTLLDGRSIMVVRLDSMAANVPVSKEGLLNFYRQLGDSIASCLRRR